MATVERATSVSIHAVGETHSKLDGLRVSVSHSVLHMYRICRGTIVHVKVTISTTFADAAAKAMATLNVACTVLKHCQVRVREGFVFTGQQIADIAVVSGDKTKACLLDAYIRTCRAFERVPLPLRMSESIRYVGSFVSGSLTNSMNLCLRVQKHVQESLVTIHIKCVNVGEYSRSKLMDVSASALKVAECNVARMKDGVAVIKGRLNGVVVIIRIKRDKGIEFVWSKMGAVYGSTKRAVEASPLFGKMSRGFDVVKEKVGDVLVFFTDRYAYTLSLAKNRILYMKSILTSVHGMVNARVVEFYVGTWSSMKRLLDHTFIVGLDRMNAAKTSFTTFSEPVLHTLRAQVKLSTRKMSALCTRTMELAMDKPFAVGATSGALVLGVGGGASGLAVGSLVGAACGFPLAFFTFGLSVPFGAVMGGGAGMCAGAAIGGAAGVASGSAVGAAVSHRGSIKGTAVEAISKLDDCRKYVGESAATSAKRVAARLRSGTGGTA